MLKTFQNIPCAIISLYMNLYIGTYRRGKLAIRSSITRVQHFSRNITLWTIIFVPDVSKICVLLPIFNTSKNEVKWCMFALTIFVVSKRISIVHTMVVFYSHTYTLINCLAKKNFSSALSFLPYQFYI